MLDDCLVIDGLKIIERDKALFISMPSRKRQDGTFADTVHPTNAPDTGDDRPQRVDGISAADREL